MNRKITTVLFFFLLSACMLYAQDVNYQEFGIDIAGGPIPHGLRSGDKAPEFSGYDQTGARVQSTKILETGPIVLFFYRGKWCQTGSNYLNDMQDSLNILTSMGVNVIAITPESIENVEQTVQLHKLTFKVIYDCQEQIMKDFDVYFNVTRDYQDKTKKELSIDIAENNGRDVAHLPVPATFIIDRQGMITAVSFDPDYHHMASVKWIIQNLASAL
jgi:peroxiredoxin